MVDTVWFHMLQHMEIHVLIQYFMKTHYVFLLELAYVIINCVLYNMLKFHKNINGRKLRLKLHKSYTFVLILYTFDVKYSVYEVQSFCLLHMIYIIFDYICVLHYVPYNVALILNLQNKIISPVGEITEKVD